MLKRITLIALLATTTATTLSGCANSDVYSGDVYTKDRAKQVQTVSYGTILSTRPVKIQADENSLIGTSGGAGMRGVAKCTRAVRVLRRSSARAVSIKELERSRP